MPFEERHILFYLNELEDIFAEQKSVLKSFNGVKPKDVKLKEVAHTSQLHRIPPEQLARISKLIDIPKNNSTTIFLGTQKKKLQKTEVCFLVPDAVLIEALKTSCLEQGIRLPKIGRKDIVAQNLIVGLKIELFSTGIALES